MGSDAPGECGPKAPVWGCVACGTKSNWSCRLRCRHCAACSPITQLMPSDPPLDPPRGQVDGDQWQLEVATYNGSSWKTAQDYLATTTARIVLVQEARVTEGGH